MIEGSNSDLAYVQGFPRCGSCIRCGVVRSKVTELNRSVHFFLQHNRTAPHRTAASSSLKTDVPHSNAIGVLKAKTHTPPQRCPSVFEIR